MRGFDERPDPLEFWKLAEELSVVDAAILITGNDPDDHYWDQDGEKRQNTNHTGFLATFGALKTAILSNRLAANVRLKARGASDRWDGVNECFHDDYATSSEGEVSYHMLMSRKESFGTIEANFDLDDFKRGTSIYVAREPDWRETTVSVDALKEWLKERNFFPPFFFASSPLDGFRDRSHPRYAPKLAACVAAWEAVRQNAPNKSVKQTLKDWLRSNASAYGAGDEQGVVSETLAGELAQIVNWNPKGGATPTQVSEQKTLKRPVAPNNYPHRIDLEGNDEGEIPF